MENILVNYNNSNYSFQEVNKLHKVIATEQTSDNSTDKINPEIKWNSKGFEYSSGSILNDEILNATASYNGQNIDGTYEYTPSEGYVIPNNITKLNIHVKFTPSTESYNSSTYYDIFNIVEKDITINII